jgi:ATP adenylyltransferase
MMLNLYPYNNGHLMIAPYQHMGAIEKLPIETLTELMAQAQLALKALHIAMNPAGFNMGINEGKVAGAGFADHIHLHIVPRWDGDTNFMPVVAGVKVMPEHLDVVYQKLKEVLLTL